MDIYRTDQVLINILKKKRITERKREINKKKYKEIELKELKKKEYNKNKKKKEEKMSKLNIQEALKTYKTTDKRTNYEKVVEWNKIFGVEMNEKPQVKALKERKEMVERGMRLIREEMRELEEAVKKEDMKETYDALCDILVVVYGMGGSLGLDLDRGVHLVNESNMSKSCKTEEEAKETVEWYKKNDKRYDTPTYRKSKCGRYWIVYNKSTGKILKSIKWQEVDFSEELKL
mgnify:CR=1 FL=1